MPVKCFDTIKVCDSAISYLSVLFHQPAPKSSNRNLAFFHRHSEQQQQQQQQRERVFSNGDEKWCHVVNSNDDDSDALTLQLLQPKC